MANAFTGEMSIQDYYRQSMEKVRSELERMPDSRVLNSSEEELVDTLVASYELERLEEDPDRERRYEGTEREWYEGRESFAGGSSRQELVYEKVSIPLVPRASNNRAIALRASTWLLHTGVEHAATYDEYRHLIILRGYEGALAKLVDQTLKLLTLLNNDICSDTPRFRSQVFDLVRMRRAVLASA